MNMEPLQETTNAVSEDMTSDESDNEDGAGPPLSDEQVTDDGLPAFGQAQVQHHLLGLQSQMDRDRGGLTDRDRSYLLSDDLEGQAARRVRMQIRDRVLNTYFDLRHLPYLSDSDRDLVFVKAADDYELHLRNALKEFVKFTHRGLAEFDVDDVEILEQAIREAEAEEAIADGELFDGGVNFDLDSTRITDLSDVRSKYERREELRQDELEALVNNDSADVDLADALYYQARQLWGAADPEWGGQRDHNYSWRDPDATRAEEIVEELRDLFDDLGIESHREFRIEWHRLVEPGGTPDHRVHELIRELDNVAPHFDQQMAAESDLSKDDMQLLHRLLWNLEKASVEDVLEEEAKPKMAGDEWMPADSQVLQKFIARVQVAREKNSFFTSGGENGRERWNRVVELAEFDREEWAEYMQERRVERCKDAIERLLESTDEVSRDDLADLLNDDAPDSELADYDALQEDQNLSQDEVENLEQFEALWTLLPDDADTEGLRDVAHWFGEGLVLEAIREAAAVGGDASE